MTTETSAKQPIGARVFERVLVGVDGSHAGREAAVQAARLVAPGGTLELATAVYLIETSLQHWPAEDIEAALELEGRPVVDAAAALAGPRATTRLLDGPPLQALLAEAGRYEATLIAVGSHGHSRLGEFLVGGVSGPLLHEASCSVLIARPCRITTFPSTVVVGHDGSPQADEALAVARQLEARFGSTTRVLVALAGKSVDADHVLERERSAETPRGQPARALVEASHDADLLVVGSRGLHGLKALGSVSERVAHQAACSVLVVRLAPPQERPCCGPRGRDSRQSRR